MRPSTLCVVLRINIYKIFASSSFYLYVVTRVLCLVSLSSVVCAQCVCVVNESVNERLPVSIRYLYRTRGAFCTRKDTFLSGVLAMCAGFHAEPRVVNKAVENGAASRTTAQCDVAPVSPSTACAPPCFEPVSIYALCRWGRPSACGHERSTSFLLLRRLHPPGLNTSRGLTLERGQTIRDGLVRKLWHARLGLLFRMVRMEEVLYYRHLGNAKGGAIHACAAIGKDETTRREGRESSRRVRTTRPRRLRTI